MCWYQILALVSLVFCVGHLTFHLLRLIRLGKPHDYAPASGKVGPAVQYSFTGAMSPGKKESAYLHLPTYGAGIIYHLGTFLSILLFFILLFVFPFTGLFRWIFSVFLFISVACGVGILIKRMVKKGLNDLSNPDDYISNILVTLFQLMTAIVLILPFMAPVYFIVVSLFLLYFPMGKLKHVLYFFAARYHLGFFYGRRGVWPPKPL
ncbi:MAG: hypothetical protein PHF97_06460 [Bacteroidales bacterium]|nr:hypothetical protein [Bacteroidales bacterium]MDD4603432.1 hypothetical protein [Bacteroidales bacterium]